RAPCRGTRSRRIPRRTAGIRRTRCLHRVLQRGLAGVCNGRKWDSLEEWEDFAPVCSRCQRPFEELRTPVGAYRHFGTRCSSRIPAGVEDADSCTRERIPFLVNQLGVVAFGKLSPYTI